MLVSSPHYKMKSSSILLDLLGETPKCLQELAHRYRGNEQPAFLLAQLPSQLQASEPQYLIHSYMTTEDVRQNREKLIK